MSRRFSAVRSLNILGAFICFVVGALMLMAARRLQLGGGRNTNTLVDLLPVRFRFAGVYAAGVACWVFAVTLVVTEL